MNKKGFTLIELLVVIAIIGLLSTLAVVALSSARQKARDSKRLSDLKQMQTALELYYTDKTAYPMTGTGSILLGTLATYDCLNASGFRAKGAGCTSPYMGLIPLDPKNTGTNVYTYKSLDVDLGTSYSLTAVLEGEVGALKETVTASPTGIQ